MAENRWIFSLFIQSRLDLYFTELSPLRAIYICGLLVRLGKHEEFMSVHSSGIYRQKKKNWYPWGKSTVFCVSFCLCGTIWVNMTQKSVINWIIFPIWEWSGEERGGAVLFGFFFSLTWRKGKCVFFLCSKANFFQIKHGWNLSRRKAPAEGSCFFYSIYK